MYRVYGLESLVSSCTLPNDSDTFSSYEEETTSITPEALSDDQIVAKVEEKIENQCVHDDERQNCSNNMKNFSKDEQQSDPLQNQNEPNERLNLKVKDPSDDQLYSPSEEVNKTIVSGQDNTYDGHVFFSDNVNIWNLEEYIQNSLIEKSPKVQDKISPMVSNDKTVEKQVIPKL